jgi:hypothetical protein
MGFAQWYNKAASETPMNEYPGSSVVMGCRDEDTSRRQNENDRKSNDIERWLDSCDGAW